MDRLTRTRNADGSSLQQAFRTTVVPVTASVRSVPTVVRWSFLLFVCALPLEVGKLDFPSSSFSLAKVFGFLFFACCLAYPKKCFPHPPGALWCFMSYAMIYLLNGLFVPEELTFQFLSSLLTLVQLIVLFWIASGLLKQERMAKNVLLTYSISWALLGLGMIFGLVSTVEGSGTGARMGALGSDPNDVAIGMALAGVISTGLLLYRRVSQGWRKTWLIALLLPSLAALIPTGSRTGVAAFMVGALVYALSQGWAKMGKTVILVFFSMVALIYMIVQDPVSSLRWHRTYYEGHTSGRTEISSKAIDMFFERPILGWHTIIYLSELGSRTNSPTGQRAAHNLYLRLLLEVGTIGAIPFLFGLWLCVRAAWKARKGQMGNLPLAALATVLSANLAIEWITRKPMWLILALALAAQPKSRIDIADGHNSDRLMRMPN